MMMIVQIGVGTVDRLSFGLESPSDELSEETEELHRAYASNVDYMLIGLVEK
jgi:hypothetical protein